MSVTIKFMAASSVNMYRYFEKQFGKLDIQRNSDAQDGMYKIAYSNLVYNCKKREITDIYQ